MNLSLLSKKKSLFFSLPCNFSIYSNSRHKIRYFIGQKEHKLDYNIHMYDDYTQAYLKKRWTTKNEIEAKIYIINPLKSILKALETQKLADFQVLLDEMRLNNIGMHEAIDTKYIISICCEPYFKPMLDQYLSKVLVNGMVVEMKDYENYAAIKQRVLDLYKRFFFGDKISLYEREIEKKYLALKQAKWHKFKIKQGKDSLINKCVWTYNEQKCLEGIRNWRNRNINLFDDFRDFYDYFPEITKSNDLQKRQSKENLDHMASVLFSRTINYCMSYELITVLEIPPDLYIEKCFLNFHIAMIVACLKKMQNPNSKKLAAILETKLDEFMLRKFIKFSIGNNNLNEYQTLKYLQLLRNITIDFLESSYFQPEKIECVIKLIEKVIYRDKKPRYSKNLKLWAFYVMHNYSYMQSLDFQKLITFFEWDIYKISYEELALKQSQSIVDPTELENMFKAIKEFEIKKRFDINWIINKISLFCRKFFISLDIYDYFNEKKEIDKKVQKLSNKYFWKPSKNQRLKEIDKKNNI